MAEYPAYQRNPHQPFPYPPQPSPPFAETNPAAVYDAYKGPRDLARTPSPTPSEAAELAKQGAFDWEKLRNWRFWWRREWLWYYVIAILITVLVALITIFHTQIVHWLKPAADWMHQLRFGWLIPIAIFFVISFPPLFGHEIVAVICGLVWGLWIGFAIVAAGTYIGEVGNFYAFKYCCRARGEKLEKTQISYACLAKVVRDGGFKIALIARFSAIPGHFTTAVFSTCGMNILVFSIAAILSLPKQFITVYLGVILEQSSEGGTTDLKTRIIDYSVVAITGIITVVAMWYIYHQMGKVKPEVVYARRKARQLKLQSSPYSNPQFASTTNVPFSTIPTDGEHQQWDKEGRAIGYSPGPVYAPQPFRPTSRSNFPASAYQNQNQNRNQSSQKQDMEEGNAYPRGLLPVRTESEESVAWDMGGGRGEGRGYEMEMEMEMEMPRVGSPPGLEPSSRGQGEGQGQGYGQGQGQGSEPVVPAIPPPPQTPRSGTLPNPYATSSPSPYAPTSSNGNAGPYATSNPNPYPGVAPSPTSHSTGPHPAARVASPAQGMGMGPVRTPTQASFNPYQPQLPPSSQGVYAPPAGPPQQYAPSTPQQPQFSLSSPIQQYAPSIEQQQFASPVQQQQYAPSTPQQFATPPQQQQQYVPPQAHEFQSFHTSEASDASFYTAAPHSRSGTEEGQVGRTVSPPPPSYHTAI